MIPLLRLTARSCKRELIASTVALVKRLMARKLKIRPIATSRIVLPNMIRPSQQLEPSELLARWFQLKSEGDHSPNVAATDANRATAAPFQFRDSPPRAASRRYCGGAATP